MMRLRMGGLATLAALVLAGCGSTVKLDETPVESRTPTAVSGQAGHNATFYAATVLVHGFALGDTEAMTLLKRWNAACVPPWSESDLEHKIRSAASSPHAQPLGHLAGQHLLRLVKRLFSNWRRIFN